VLLAFDIGNTNLTLGLFEGDRLRESWRLETVHARTADEYALLVRQLLGGDGIAVERVTGTILASVVPVLTRTIAATIRRVFGHDPMIVGPGLKTGVPVLYNPPKDVGADRIVNAVAAFRRYASACIVVDFGTATTFDCVTGKGEYAGGAIAPGIQTSLEALFLRAAKLPKVDFARPPAVIGKSTVDSIQSGAFFGYASLVDGLVRRMRAEMPEPTVRVIATGGLARSLAEITETIEVVDENLTLEGLAMLHALNSG
jgi:type III pantothenate kinase